jgi:hypothetical protein
MSDEKFIADARISAIKQCADLAEGIASDMRNDSHVRRAAAIIATKIRTLAA